MIGGNAYRLIDNDGKELPRPTNKKYLKIYYPTMWEIQEMQEKRKEEPENEISQKLAVKMGALNQNEILKVLTSYTKSTCHFRVLTKVDRHAPIHSFSWLLIFAGGICLN